MPGDGRRQVVEIDESTPERVHPMARDVVVIGASAGGVDALRKLVSELPEDLAASVLVVLHLPAAGHSSLPEILERAGPLRAIQALDGAGLNTGVIYVAPPGHHLLVGSVGIRLTAGPRENGHRPSIDVLFRTAAHTLGPRVIGVVLSGSLDDGSVGLMEIKARGGVTMVQDPSEAQFPDMPFNALRRTGVDFCLPVAAIAEKIGQLTQGEGQLAVDVAEAEMSPERRNELLVFGSRPRPAEPDGEVSVFTCPECRGTLREVRTKSGNIEFERYVCRVGHSYSVEALDKAQSDSLEAALWTALRALDERYDLSSRLEQSARRTGRRRLAIQYEDRARATLQSSTAIRQALETMMGGEPEAAELAETGSG